MRWSQGDARQSSRRWFVWCRLATHLGFGGVQGRVLRQSQVIRCTFRPFRRWLFLASILSRTFLCMIFVSFFSCSLVIWLWAVSLALLLGCISGTCWNPKPFEGVFSQRVWRKARRRTSLDTGYLPAWRGPWMRQRSRPSRREWPISFNQKLQVAVFTQPRPQGQKLLPIPKWRSLHPQKWRLLAKMQWDYTTVWPCRSWALVHMLWGRRRKLLWRLLWRLVIASLTLARFMKEEIRSEQLEVHCRNLVSSAQRFSLAQRSGEHIMALRKPSLHVLNLWSVWSWNTSTSTWSIGRDPNLPRPIGLLKHELKHGRLWRSCWRMGKSEL